MFQIGPTTCSTTQPDVTLLEALALKGGKSACGARETLLRAAVAAMLNAAHPDVDYSLTVSQVQAEVNAALASGDRKTMLALAARLDSFNNRFCELN